MPARLAVLLLLAACAKVPPAAFPDPDAPRVYKVGVATAQGDAVATSITTLRVIPRGDDVYAFLTERSEGSWEQGAAAMTFDSEDPKGTDPWPITLQHAVATVPAPIRVHPRTGALQAFQQQEVWRSAARSAVEAADLPVQARLSAESLLDPEGVLRDLRRNFPGTPTEDGPWVREETIAGVPTTRVERCEAETVRATTTWTCSGRLAGPEEGPARLVDGVSKTVLTVDRDGLVELDLTYEATLIVLGSREGQVLDRPVFGRRKVVRQPR